MSAYLYQGILVWYCVSWVKFNLVFRKSLGSQNLHWPSPHLPTSAILFPQSILGAFCFSLVMRIDDCQVTHTQHSLSDSSEKPNSKEKEKRNPVPLISFTFLIPFWLDIRLTVRSQAS